MTGKYLLGSLLASAVLLSAHSAANATPLVTFSTPLYGAIASGTTYYYSTSSSVAAAPGTLAVTSHATSSNGGLCEIASNPTWCSPISVSSGNQGPIVSGTGTTSSAGLIELDTPLAVANYLLTITIANKTTGKGDIFDVVVNGASLGTTKVVNSTDSSGSGTFSTVISGGNNSPIFISVTDLLQQYLGSTNYDLPSFLGGSSGLNSPSGLGLTFDQQSVFTLQATLVPDPEPASLSVLAAGTFALGFARRRFRAKPSSSAS